MMSVIGQRVLAQGTNGLWYWGVVQAVNERTVEIRLDSGVVESIENSRVQEGNAPNSPDALLPGARVSGLWVNGLWYPGVVTQVVGRVSHVQFDDGDRAWLDSTRLRLGPVRRDPTTILKSLFSGVGGVQLTASPSQRSSVFALIGAIIFLMGSCCICVKVRRHGNRGDLPAEESSNNITQHGSANVDPEASQGSTPATVSNDAGVGPVPTGTLLRGGLNAEIIAQAVTSEVFESRLRSNEWVFFDHGVRSCDSEDEPDYLPPGENEFARREQLSRREDLRRQLVGTLVTFHGTGTLNGADQVFDTIDLGRSFCLSRTSYDFHGHRYRFNIVANSDDSDARWPICLNGQCSAIIRPSSYQEVVNRTIGRIGNRDVRVRDVETDIEWQNFSNISINVPMDEEQARQYVSQMPVEATVVLRFLGLSHHQRCQRHCDVIFGERTCGGDDEGFGLQYRAELVAYEIKIAGAVAAQLDRTQNSNGDLPENAASEGGDRPHRRHRHR